MAGIQIDGVNNKIDFDDDLDTSISANTDDTLVIEAGGNTMATITATTFTINDGTTITTADNTDTLSLISTDADENVGPVLRLFRNSASPADDDVIGNLIFSGQDGAGNETDFLTFQVNASDVANGAEDGFMRIMMPVASASTEFIRMNPAGVVFNEGSANLDFRVESDDRTHMFHIDAANNNARFDSTNSDVSQEVYGLTPLVQIRGNHPNNASLLISEHVADSNGASLFFYKSRNTTPGSFTSVAINDAIGIIHFIADDGSDAGSKAALIGCEIDAAPGTNDTPGRLVFYTTADGAADSTERMRIHANGRTQFNLETMGSVVSTSNAGIDFVSGLNPQILMATNGTGNNSMLKFLNDNGEVGSIKTNGSATAYNTSSDYRLKENVVTDWDATTRLKQLKPSRFNFKADADTTVDGFLAHEVSSIVPEAINGDKDETETKTNVVVHANGDVIDEGITEARWTAGKVADEDGKRQYPTDSTWVASKVVPVYQAIDQSKLVPLLVKTIQELEARIEVLEG